MQAAKAETKAERKPKNEVSSQAVIASMRRHGIRFTSANYAVWCGYLAGSQPGLTRTIDIFLSNGRPIDDAALQTLFARHFCAQKCSDQLRTMAKAGLVSMEAARASSGQAACFDDAAHHFQRVVAQSETLVALLHQSAERTALLESFLHDATRDASTDALTGLPNRRAFDATLRSMAGDAMNSGAELAVVLLDIDHFKQVNDHWGHRTGDEVLASVAEILTRTVRGGDFAARYGGEEFALILPDTGRRGGLAVAENVREAVAAQPLAIATGQLSVTLSAGISCYLPGEPLGECLARSDAALYCAKHAGRNRVVFGTAPPRSAPAHEVAALRA